jgi:hypothetical protein
MENIAILSSAEYSPLMAKKKKTNTNEIPPTIPAPPPRAPASGENVRAGKPSSLLDTRVVYCGDNLEQLAKLPDACIDLIYIDPPSNSNYIAPGLPGVTSKTNRRIHSQNKTIAKSNPLHPHKSSPNKRECSFEDHHASTQAYINYMRPRYVQIPPSSKRTGSFYRHCDWHASTPTLN